jgi:transposase-like protein
MATRRRWSERERRELLAVHAESGLSLSAFAREFGVPLSTIARWRRARGASHSAAVPRLLPVEVVDGPALARSAIEAFAGGVTVRVPAEADDALLARIVRALRSC